MTLVSNKQSVSMKENWVNQRGICKVCSKKIRITETMCDKCWQIALRETSQ